MALGKGATGQGRSTRKAKNPVDIALDAGMRPMLIGHGFQRKTKRYFVRETDKSIQFVPIYAGTRRGYQGGAGFGACGCVLNKEILKLSDELQLGTLDPRHRNTNHDCHLTCDLRAFHYFFNIRPYKENLKERSILFRLSKTFSRGPEFEDGIPEIAEFRTVYSRFEDNIESEESIPLIEDYGKLRADVFERYIIPWFEKCEDIKFATRWIGEIGGQRYSYRGMLAATACCVSGDLETARTAIRGLIKNENKTQEDYYKECRRPSLSIFSFLHVKSARYCNKYARFAYGYFRQQAIKARALAERFGIELE